MNDIGKEFILKNWISSGQSPNDPFIINLLTQEEPKIKYDEIWKEVRKKINKNIVVGEDSIFEYNNKKYLCKSERFIFDTENFDMNKLVNEIINSFKNIIYLRKEKNQKIYFLLDTDEKNKTFGKYRYGMIIFNYIKI